MADAPGPTAKTKTCRFFETKKGCKFGNDCSFLHPEKLSNESGSISLDNQKKPDSAAKICRFVQSKRGCQFENECHFLHTEKVPNESGSISQEVGKLNDDHKQSDTDINLSSKPATPNNKTLAEQKGMEEHKDSSDRQGIVCKFFKKKKGCLRGNRCPFVHVASGDGATLKPLAKKNPNKANKPTSPHQGKEISRPIDDTEQVAKQPLESVNLLSENQHEKRDRQATGQGISMLCNKDDSTNGSGTVLSDDNLGECKRLRSTEIEQLKRRFRSQGGYCEIQENASYKIKFKPTDPDWPFNIDAVYLTVYFPEDYPLHIFDVSLSEGQGLPQDIINFVTQKIQQWALKQEQMNKDHRIMKLYFRPFLRWFDRNLESLFIDGGRQMRRSSVSRITADGIPTNYPAPDSLVIPDLVTGSRPDGEHAEDTGYEDHCSSTGTDSGHVKITQNNGSSDMFEREDGEKVQSLCSDNVQDTNNDTFEASTSLTDINCVTNVLGIDHLKQVVDIDSTPSTVGKQDLNYEQRIASEGTAQTNQSEPHSHCDDTAASRTARRGTEIQLRGLNLEENVSTLRGIRIVLTFECNRCRQRIDQQMSVSGSVNRQCTRCASVFAVTYRPAIIHQFSSVLGYLDLDGCIPFDVILPQSQLMLGCLHCSKETTVKGLQYGANWSWCSHCHTKLGFQLQSTRFQQLQISSSTTASLRKNKDSSTCSKPKKQTQSSGIKEGQPLPDNGTCKHYKKSFRWLRFPCCGKCYPCDLCHEEREDHEVEYATRMVCGFCSREQPYSQQPCTGCKAGVTKSRSAHWEGGKGCRDKVAMNRNDEQKYRQSGKTSSRKAQKRSEGKGKGKGNKGK